MWRSAFGSRTARTSRRCATCRSPCASTRWWPWSGRPGAARARCSACSPGWRARSTGRCCTAAMVFQSFALLPWLTVAENVAMGLEARGVDGPARRDAVARAINLVGLDGFEQAYPKELSGGMKQRVGFARALAVAPEILLMDEPFGALDPLTAENLRSQVVDLWRDPATGVNTLVIVTHSVEEAVFLAGRIVVFGSNPGHVREEMANPLPYPRQERSPEFEEMV